jgi:hypothetical protein
LKIKFILTAAAFCLISVLQGCILFKGGNSNPAVLKNPAITDGESLVYYGYEKGEFLRVGYFVSRIDSNTDITMYFDGTNVNSKIKKLPENYTDYEYRFSFSCRYGTLLQSWSYWLPLAKLEGYKGNVGLTLDIDIENLRASIIEYNWDGENLTKKSARMNLKRGYSYWDINSFGLIGMRFFEPEKGGIAYVIASEGAKDPIPISFRFYGEESLTVPAGNFKTKKYGFVISDPFLSGLLGKFASEYYAWIDESPKAFLVQSITMEGITYKLAKIGYLK